MEVAPQYQNIPPFLTETELEVAAILSELPELLRDPGDRPHVPPHLRWGARRRRRCPRLRSSSSPSAAIPENDPSPSTSLPHRPHLDDDETKGDAAAAAAAAIAGSPTSPLSFPASGSEEPECHPPRPPPPQPAPSITWGVKYSSKNSKHHNEMLKEYSHVVASLSAESCILRKEIEQYKINCTILKAENSLLIEHRSKIVLPKLPKAEAEAEAAPSAVGAPPADSAAEHRQPSATAKRKVEFDLNKISAEAAAAAAAAEREAAAAAAAQSAHRAAKSAKARRRRMEIQRAKSVAISAAAAATAVSAPGSMPSTVHKMPRLR